MKRAIIVLLIVAGIGAGAGAYYIRRNGTDFQVNTAQISQGEIIDTVAATGALQAVTTVQIGAQVSGNIAWLGADYNSIVHKNQVIARIDPSIFQAAVDQAKANMAKSQADYAKAQSDVEHGKVAVLDAQQKYDRAKALSERKLIAQSDLDAAKIALDSAQAELQSNQAAAQSSRAAIQQAQASVNQNLVNLEHCTISTPIDGIVTSRNVDVGQTVASSFQSPTLFTVAADLTKMQVLANVDEADVGRIRPNQDVVFKVDAFPTDEFRGKVTQIRLQPIVVQNVTTYGTLIDVPNEDLRLKPGMTANVKIQIARRANALRVPNAALRFRPNADMFAALGQALPPELAAPGRGRGRTAQAGGPGSPQSPAGTPESSVAGRQSPGGGGPGGGQPMASRGMGAGGATPGGAPGMSRGGEPGGSDQGDRHARMLERFKSMSPDEQKQFLQRMKDRGVDTSDFEKASGGSKPVVAAKAAHERGAETIDALFAPLPPVESSGRAWLFANRQLKSVRLRLGITDGTYTEILDANEIQPGTEVVTGIVMSGTRTTSGGAANPLMGPQRGGPMGGRPPGR